MYVSGKKTSLKCKTMLNSGRDILVINRNETLQPEAYKKEIAFLGKILYSSESIKNFCMVNEVIDINRFKIIRKAHHIQQLASEYRLKPFVFFFNKN